MRPTDASAKAGVRSAGPGQQGCRGMRRWRAVGQQAERLLQDNRADVTFGRVLVARLIDLALGNGRDGLVRRHGVDRKETGRVAGQAVQRDHPDPGVDRVVTDPQAGAQGLDLAQRAGMVEGEKIGVGRFGPGLGQVDVDQTVADRVDSGRVKTGTGQHRTEWIDVVCRRRPAHQGCLNRGGASAGERVVNAVTGDGQAVDEERRQLGFEAGSVADFVQAVTSALAGGPEGVDEVAQARGLELLGGRTIEREAAQGVREPARPRRGDYCRNGLAAFSAPIVEPGPCPHRNIMSSPSGSSLVLIASIRAAWSP